MPRYKPVVISGDLSTLHAAPPPLLPPVIASPIAMLVRYSDSFFFLSPIPIGILSEVPKFGNGYILHVLTQLLVALFLFYDVENHK